MHIHKSCGNISERIFTNSLITPYKLQEIINSVKETLIRSNSGHGIVIKRLHLYYNMKLVTSN